MKRYGALLALVLAVFSGLVAVVLANRWLSKRAQAQKPAVAEAVPSTKIVIAAKDLDVGTRITSGSLTLAEWPKAVVPRGAFEDPAALEGRIAVTRLNAGQPVLAAELAGPDSGVGLVATIKPGKRAMSIKVDEVVGVSGFVLPNTYVDVVSVSEGKNNERRTVKTILKRVEVLAIAQETFTEEGKPKVVKTVTLQLAPKEVEELALETHQGAIHLALRNPADEAEPPKEEPKPVAKAAPVRKPRPAPVPVVATPVAVAPQPFTVEIIRGSKPPETVRFKNAESEERLQEAARR